MNAFCSLSVLSTVASGLNALAAVTVEDFAPLVVRHIPTERETLVSKLLGNCLLLVFSRVSKGLCVTRELKKKKLMTREKSSNLAVIRELLIAYENT